MPIRIAAEKCTGCGECMRVCVPEALSVVNGVIRVDADKCVECGACVQVCPHGALELVLEAAPVPRPSEVVELQARPVARPRAEKPSVEWLGILGRAAGALVTFLLDRAASSGGLSPAGRRTGGSGRMKRIRRRGGR